MKLKIKQISADGEDGFYALTQDGRVFYFHDHFEAERQEWREIEIPDEDEDV